MDDQITLVKETVSEARKKISGWAHLSVPKQPIGKFSWTFV